MSLRVAEHFAKFSDLPNLYILRRRALQFPCKSLKLGIATTHAHRYGQTPVNASRSCAKPLGRSFVQPEQRIKLIFQAHEDFSIEPIHPKCGRNKKVSRMAAIVQFHAARLD